jgi:hypothetical protein
MIDHQLIQYRYDTSIYLRTVTGIVVVVVVVQSRTQRQRRASAQVGREMTCRGSWLNPLETVSKYFILKATDCIVFGRGRSQIRV